MICVCLETELFKNCSYSVYGQSELLNWNLFVTTLFAVVRKLVAVPTACKVGPRPDSCFWSCSWLFCIHVFGPPGFFAQLVLLLVPSCSSFVSGDTVEVLNGYTSFRQEGLRTLHQRYVMLRPMLWCCCLMVVGSCFYRLIMLLCDIHIIKHSSTCILLVSKL